MRCGSNRIRICDRYCSNQIRICYRYCTIKFGIGTDVLGNGLSMAGQRRSPQTGRIPCKLLENKSQDTALVLFSSKQRRSSETCWQSQSFRRDSFSTAESAW